MAMQSGGPGRTMSEINVTPMVDVMLVLLIIFMILAALVAPPGFEKELPNKSNSNPANNPKNKQDIEVEVNNKGVIFVDGARTDQVGIYRMMYEVSKKKPRHHVSIIADAKGMSLVWLNIAPYQIPHSASAVAARSPARDPAIARAVAHTATIPATPVRADKRWRAA